jgi:hypothetical protein
VTQYTAVTAYGVPIPRYLGDRKAALEWAETEGDRFPGSRIIQHTSQGPRTIWRHEAEKVAA